MPEKDRRKSGVHKQRRKQSDDVTILNGKTLLRSAKKLSPAKVVTPPIASRLRSANRRFKVPDIKEELTTIQPKQKTGKPIALESRPITNGVHLKDVVDCDMQEALNHSSLNGFSQNSSGNSETTKAPSVEPVRSSRFCTVM
uniref:Uncharacterized protein n=1 Tax=Trichobilharzia regenti TaxID=157069 RepID=A0AA85K0W7_TRIRE|nr:unnamed protein product [Trichobilharzia regenti]